MSRGNRYSPELRERAVKLFFDHKSEYQTEWKAMQSISQRLGMSAESLRTWIRRTEIDTGERPGLTTDERVRLKALEKENRELRRANEILKDAAVFFATELDGQPKR